MLIDVRLDTATLVAAWCEALLFGVFLVLFIICIYVLGPLSQQTNGAVNKPLLITAMLLFVLITSHVAVALKRLLSAFVDNEPDPGAIAFLSDAGQWTEATTDLLYVLVTLTGDAILIYRCWVVWARRWYSVVLPIFIFLGTAVTGFKAVAILYQLTGGQNIFASQLAGWITAYFACTLVTNTITTLLIVFRIWRSNVDVTRFGQQSLQPVIATVLESGAVYSCTVFILLMLYVAKTNAQYIVLAMEIPIIGIVFSLIIVRVGLNRVSRTNSGIAPAGRTLNLNGLGSRDPYQLKPVHVSVSRTTEMENYQGEDDDTLDIGRGKDAGELV